MCVCVCVCVQGVIFGNSTNPIQNLVFDGVRWSIDRSIARTQYTQAHHPTTIATKRNACSHQLLYKRRLKHFPLFRFIDPPADGVWGHKYYFCKGVQTGVAVGGTWPVPPCFTNDSEIKYSHLNSEYWCMNTYYIDFYCTSIYIFWYLVSINLSILLNRTRIWIEQYT